MTGLDEPAWYKILTEFNSIENTFLIKKYEEFWKNRDEDELDELIERYTERFSTRRSATQYRKNALTTVMGAFLNRHNDNGRIYEETGWEFRELDPFEMENDVSADILLAKPSEGETMIVILLPERESPNIVVEQSIQGIKAVQDNLSRFGYQAAPDGIYSAIVVNPPRDEETKTAIDSTEGGYSSDIFVWRVYDVKDQPDDQPGSDQDSTEEQKLLDYYAELDNQLNTTGPNMRLLDVLEEGVRINQDREILPDFFLQSHHSVFLEHVIGNVVKKRENNDDGPLSHFARRELEEYIESTLFQRGVSEESIQKAEILLSRWERMDLIKSIKASRNDIVGDDFYRFDVNGSLDQDNIIKAVTEDYHAQTAEFYIEIDAMEEALDAYRDEYGEQTTLTSGFDS